MQLSREPDADSVERECMSIAERHLRIAIHHGFLIEACNGRTIWGEHVEAVAMALDTGDLGALARYAYGEIVPDFPYRSLIWSYLNTLKI